MATNPFTVVGGEGRKRGPGRPPLGNYRDPSTITDYDVNSFYTRGSDDNGHRMLVHVNYPQDWGWMVAKIVHEFPAYNSPADLLRDSMFHRMKFLLEHRMDDPAMAQYAERKARDLAAAQRRSECDLWDVQLEEATDTLRHYERRGYVEGLAAELDRLSVWATEVPDPWKSAALDLLTHYRPSDPAT